MAMTSTLMSSSDHASLGRQASNAVRACSCGQDLDHLRDSTCPRCGQSTSHRRSARALLPSVGTWPTELIN